MEWQPRRERVFFGVQPFAQDKMARAQVFIFYKLCRQADLRRVKIPPKAAWLVKLSAHALEIGWNVQISPRFEQYSPQVVEGHTRECRPITNLCDMLTQQ